jgi:hypothetical protein
LALLANGLAEYGKKSRPHLSPRESQGQPDRYELWGTVDPPRPLVRERFPDGSMSGLIEIRDSTGPHASPERPDASEARRFRACCSKAWTSRSLSGRRPPARGPLGGIVGSAKIRRELGFRPIYSAVCSAQGAGEL